MDDVTLLSQQLKQEAHALGFDLVAITKAVPPPHADALDGWLAAGNSGEMAYLARNAAKRKQPDLVVAGARSIIVVGLHYRAAEPDPTIWNDASHGQISRYAWGDDYHEILEPRLRRLQTWLEQRVGRAQIGRSYVDTGPVLERPVAVAAGLGFQGKNTLLIHPQQGSWFLLGEIIVDCELEYDEQPARGGCGSCTRCQVACPTQAFVGPYVLDARRCISYLTIELKGPIPRELRPLMGNHIYGCDVCQEVCPWNIKFGQFASSDVLQARDDRIAPALLELIALDDEAFRDRFRGSPIKRTKRRGLLRNVAVALGNWGDMRAVPALTLALDDHEALIRGHVAWALGRIGGDKARLVLDQRYAIETDDWVCEELGLALEACGIVDASCASDRT